MRVIGHHEHAIAEDSHAAIDAAACITCESGTALPLVAPDLAPGASVEGERGIRCGDVHDTFDDDRSDFESATRAGDGEDPLGREASDVAAIDLVERAEAA